MWNDLPLPAVIAHRGDKAHTPENTLPAFIKAAEKGADAIELDVKLCGDGHVVVLHDQTVDRTTNSKGDISQLSFAEIRKITANAQFPGSFLDARIPCLEEVFEAVGERMHINIELTNYATPTDTLVQKVIELVKKYRMRDRILLSSFLPHNLELSAGMLPETPRALLALPGFKGRKARISLWRNGYAALNPFFTDVNNKLLKKIHAVNKKVYVWTIRSRIEARWMIKLGVDGLIADDPEMVLRLLGRFK
jgi:glycerophosphoryl diester phosphodiesterase